MSSVRSIRRSPVERLLGAFTEIRAGEGRIALLLTLSVFLLLAAYYFIKPARDGLLAVSGIDSLSKTELKAYVSVAQGFVLMVLVPMYTRLAGRMSRRRLITSVNLFFAANLVAFWLLQPGLLLDRAVYVGIAFYLWVGIFNLAVLAQFWIFAADLYDQERGRRIFPVIALGASAGAVAGSWLVERLVSSSLFGTHTLLLLAAALLTVATVLSRCADGASTRPVGMGARGGVGRRGTTRRHVLGRLLRHRYLAATAVVVLTTNWVNTGGESLLFGTVQESVEQEIAGLGVTDPVVIDRLLADRTTGFYGSLFFWTNLAALVLQALFVSRMVKQGGLGLTLTVLPVVSLLAYSVMALFPILAVVGSMKVAENATAYSVNNTAREILWLPTTSEMRYAAKPIIDTIVVRLGDGLAALTIFVGLHVLRLGLPELYGLNLAVVAVWLLASFVILREHGRLRSRDTDPEPAAAGSERHPSARRHEPNPTVGESGLAA